MATAIRPRIAYERPEKKPPLAADPTSRRSLKRADQKELNKIVYALRDAQQKARRASKKLRAEQALAATRALLERHPGTSGAELQIWAQWVVGYQRGGGDEQLRGEVERLLGADHPLLLLRIEESRGCQTLTEFVREEDDR